MESGLRFHTYEMQNTKQHSNNLIFQRFLEKEHKDGWQTYKNNRSSFLRPSDPRNF